MVKGFDLNRFTAWYGANDALKIQCGTGRTGAGLRVPENLSSRRTLLKLCGLVVGGSVANCSGPGSNLAPLPAPESAAYHLGPNDRIRVITLDAPEMTGEFFVNDSGNLALPQIGTLPAAGLTPRDLEQSIADKLKKMELLRDPSVSIEVVQYRPIFVLGEVNNPGEYPYQPGITADTAVAVAGGFTYRAIEDRFSVVRVTGRRSVEGRVDRQAFLQPGDVLTVYERYF